MINISKCYILHLDPPHEYNIQGTTMSDTIKDLGIHIDNNLKFHAHTSSVVSKVNHTLAIICKSFHFTNNQMFITL